MHPRQSRASQHQFTAHCGGNFGLVAAFDFDLHEFGTTLNSGSVVYPFSEARKVLQFLAEYGNQLPNEATLERARGVDT